MILSRLKYFSAIAVPVLAIASLPMHASTILSENFDEVTANLAVTSAGAFSAINGTNVDVVGAGDGFAALCAGPESGNCVDLGGSGGNAFGQLALTTSLNLTAGVYDLSFDLIGSGRGDSTSTTVSFGNYTHTFVLDSADVTSGIVVDQAVTVAGGATQLSFINNDTTDANVGAVLDNVTITTPGAAPEPSSLMLLGTGLAGAAGMLRRKLAA